jgi:hypothetical protein
MAVFEVQFAVAAFLKAQKARLKSEDFCPPEPIPVEQLGVQIQIQRLEFGANELRRGPSRTWDILYINGLYGSPPRYLYPTDEDADGFAVHLAQDVSIHASLLQDILGNPNLPAPEIAPIQVRLVFDLDYYPFFDEGCLLRLQLHHLEWPVEPTIPGVPPDVVKGLIATHVSSAFEARTVPFNFAKLVPPKLKEVANAGVSLSADGQVLAFRADPFGTPYGSSDKLWSYFCQGNFENRLAGLDWALFTDSRTMCANIANQVESSLREKPIPHADVDAVSANYQVVDGVATIVAHVGVYAEIPVWGSEYYNFDIPCAISLEAESSSLVFDIDLSDIGAQMAWLGLFVERLRWIFPPLGWTLELAFADELSRLRQLPAGVSIEPEEFVCEAVDPSHRRCRRPAIMPAVPDITLAAERVSAYADGFAINGRVLGADLPQGTLEMQPGKFAWSVRSVSCSSPDETIRRAQENPQAFAYLYLEHELKTAGPGPNSAAHFCSFEVVNDPQNLYPKGWPQIVVQSKVLPTKLTVTMDAGAVLPPYPMDIVVRTNAGVQLLRAAPPAAFDHNDALLVSGAVKAAMLACPMVPAWWGALGNGFDLAWIENPLLDPDRTIVAHHVELHILGNAAPQQIAVEARGGFVKQVTAAGGRMTVSVTAPTDTRVRLQARRPGERRMLAEHAERASVQMNVAALRRRSTLQLGEPARAVRLTRYGDHEAALVVTRTGILLVGLSRPDGPSVLRRWHLPDAQGAVLSDAVVVAWTARSTLMLGAECGRHTQAIENLVLRTGPLRDAAAIGSKLYCLSHVGVSVVDASSWRRLGFAAIEGATCLLAAFGHVFIGGTFGIAAADLSDSRGLALRQVTAPFAVSKLRLGLGSNQTLIARDDEASELEFVFERRRLRHSARATGTSPFDHWDVRGDTVAYLLEGGETLGLATLGATRAVVPLISRQASEHPKESGRQ